MNRNKLESKSQKYNLYAGSSAILLALNILFILYREIRRKVTEQQERLFILQTLTHELRTPVASMKLNLEPFRRNFDHLAPDGQKAFLRMTEGVRRLNHVIKASSQYLQSHTEEGQMKFQMDAVHSVNELAAYIVEDFVSDHVEIKLIETDQDLSLYVDVYWLSMCLKNLFKNAQKYGVAPIQLKVISRGVKEVGFAVIDQGQLELSTLKGFLSPFQRQSKEEGLGLGLTLVNRIAKKMGGRLEVKARPTTFCLWMPAFNSKEDYDEIITG
jgi:signal transduction histidine kinase